MLFAGKNIVVGVTGCIAAYKTCQLVSDLVGEGANVDVILTENATNFVTAQTFETLSRNPVTVDMFDRDRTWEVGHISLAQKADLIIISPCTANVIGKLAGGIADDMLTTTVLATKAPVLIAPAMNTNMYTNKIFQANMAKLANLGFSFVGAVSGRLACGDVGVGHIADESDILSAARRILFGGALSGKTVLVTVGATEEAIDGVRFITNRSSGKMGTAIARQALRRGAKVILIAGRVSVNLPKGAEIVNVKTTSEMYKAVMGNYERADIIIKAAAPSDYRPAEFIKSKIKDKEIELHLVKNADIAAAVGAVKGERKLVIFSAETDNLLENAKGKLVSKNADLVVANDVTAKGAGFEGDTNIATLIGKDGDIFDTGLVSKDRLAEIILDRIQ